MEKTLELLEFNKILNMLASKTDTVMGRELVEDLRPVSNLALLEKWQKETTDGCSLLTKINFNLSGITDLRPLLVRCRRGGSLNSLQLREVANNLLVLKKSKKILMEYGRSIILDMTGGIGDFHRLERELLSSISEEGEVLDNASNELSRIRKEIRTARGRIQRELDRVLKSSTFNRYLQENIVTQRNNRYVVPVKVEYKAQVQGIVHDQSASGSTLFIEPVTVVEANNHLNQLHNQEQKEINRILADLSDEVSKNYDDLREALNTAAEIDFILSKSK
ncbi:MAG: endonuclease MutS2, partial [Firmicutes bacterium HGW-Firmicutes-13]